MQKSLFSQMDYYRGSENVLTGVLFLTHTFLGYAVDSDVCLWETITPSCYPSEVIFVESARYGRMHNARCDNLTDGEQTCFADVRHQIQRNLIINRNSSIRLTDESIRTVPSNCSGKLMPFLRISYRCVNVSKTEVCFWESFDASCPEGQVVSIQYALFGRMRSSRCIYLDAENLGCSADVQRYFESLCNGKRSCSSKPADLKATGTSCSNRLQYLDILYYCTSGFKCLPYVPLEDEAVEKAGDGYRLSCLSNDRISWEVQCVDGQWNSQPHDSCNTSSSLVDGFPMKIMVITVAVTSAVVIFIVASAIAFKKRRVRNQMQISEQRQQPTAAGATSYLDLSPGELAQPPRMPYQHLFLLESCNYEEIQDFGEEGVVSSRVNNSKDSEGVISRKETNTRETALRKLDSSASTPGVYLDPPSDESSVTYEASRSPKEQLSMSGGVVTYSKTPTTSVETFKSPTKSQRTRGEMNLKI